MTDNKALPFPEPSGSPEPSPLATRHQRVIFGIGGQRLADLLSVTSEQYTASQMT
jgi:hypothetical protein